jgi:excisionase family DNA binding protein
MNPNATTTEVFVPEQVAEMLHCKVTTVEELARRGDLPALKFGKDGWVFPAVALFQRLNELALEQARQRGRPSQRQPAAVLQQVVDKRKRTPPVLPKLP